MPNTSTSSNNKPIFKLASFWIFILLAFAGVELLAYWSYISNVTTSKTDQTVSKKNNIEQSLTTLPEVAASAVTAVVTEKPTNPGISHCFSGEETLFHCAVSPLKVITLCKFDIENKTFLALRYGPAQRYNNSTYIKPSTLILDDQNILKFGGPVYTFDKSKMTLNQDQCQTAISTVNPQLIDILTEVASTSKIRSKTRTTDNPTDPPQDEATQPTQDLTQTQEEKNKKDILSQFEEIKN